MRKAGERLIIEPAKRKSLLEVLSTLEPLDEEWPKGSQRLSDQVETVHDAIEILPFEPPADATYAVIRASLENMGRPIGSNDLLIAAHAITLDCTQVTDNERDFQRIRGLSSVNWLR